MLNNIKNLINTKIALQESANAILEGSTGMDLDDAIVLGEDNEFNNDTPVDEDDDDIIDDQENLDGDGDNENSEDVASTGNDGDEPESIPGGDENAEITNPLDDEVDDLPTPIGAQTGEPVHDNIEDIMKMEIDLKSNTMSNVLPVPPANAGEAIASDDIGTQHVDSGFGGTDSEGITESSSNSNLPGSKDEEFKLHRKIEESSKNVEEAKAKYFKTLFGKDLNSIQLEEIPDTLSIKIGTTSFDFKASVGHVYDDNGNSKENKHFDDVPAAVYLYQINKADICDEIGKKLNKKLIDYIQYLYKRDPGYYGGGTPSNDIDENLKRFKFKPRKVYFNMYGHIGFAMDSDIEPEHGVGFTIWPNMNVTVGDAAEDIFESTITEGISLAGGMGDESATDTTGDPAPIDDASTDVAPDTDENAVTAAVRDKVNEADAVEDVANDTTTTSAEASKEDLLKRLGNITKNIEDTKKAIMDAIK